MDAMADDETMFELNMSLFFGKNSANREDGWVRFYLICTDDGGWSPASHFGYYLHGSNNLMLRCNHEYQAGWPIITEDCVNERSLQSRPTVSKPGKKQIYDISDGKGNAIRTFETARDDKGVYGVLKDPDGVNIFECRYDNCEGYICKCNLPI